MKKLMKRCAQTVGAILIVLLLLVAIAAVFIDWIARYGVEMALQKQGLDAQVESVDFVWLIPSLTISGVTAETPDGDNVALATLHVATNWRSLREKIVSIDSVKLTGVEIPVILSDSGITVAGIQLPNDDSTTATDNAAAENQVSEPAPPTDWRVSLHQLALSDITACVDRQNIAPALKNCAHLADMDWSGKVEVVPADEQPINVASELLTLNDLLVYDDASQQKLLSLANLTVKDLQWAGDTQISAGAIQLDDIAVLRSEENSVVQVALISLEAMHASPALLQADSLLISGVGSHIVRNAEGHLYAEEQLRKILGQPEPALTPPIEEPTEEPAATGTHETFIVKLKEFTLKDSEPLQFIDDSLASELKVEAVIKRMHVAPIDTGNPNQASEIELAMTVDEHSQITAKGTITALQKLTDVQLDGKISGLDLRPVGLYIESGAGSRIKSGQLDSEFKVVARAGELDSYVELNLQKFKLKPAVNDDDGEVSKMLGIPANQALSLLRDSDDRIHLKIPITGDIDSPSFNLNHAIQKAMASAITTAVVNYYTPFGLVNVGKGLFDLATALRFDPVMFEPGSSELKDTSTLKKIEDMMNDRPGVSVTLCGFSNQRDRLVLFEETPDGDQPLPPPEKANKRELLKLADTRALSLKGLLTKDGIAAERLVLCDAEYGADTIAGVEVSL